MGKKMSRQHEVLRVPNGWTEQDKALVMQLERIHDDLYNRLTKAITGQVFSVLGITPDDDGDVTLTKEAIMDIGIPDIGTIRMFTGNTAPDMWKICDGSVISRETYSALFAVIGSTYGGGDGSTTFAIPDFKGRSPLGVGESTAAGHTEHTLGQMSGEEKHVLTTDEHASHSHGLSGAVLMTYKRGSETGNAAHNTGTAITFTDRVTRNTNNQGSGTAHNTMHPYTGVNFIIYTGVSDAA